MDAPLNLSFWHLVYALPAFISTMLTVGLLVYTFVQPRRPAGGIPFFLFMLATSIWSACYALDPLMPTLAGKVLVDKAAYLGITTLPVLWLLFVLVYRGSREHLSPLRIALLFVVPAATTMMVWTNDLHHLHWVRETLLTDVAPLPVFRADRGPWFYVNMTYSYALLLGATLLLAEIVHRSTKPYRAQAAILLAASLVPWAFNLFTILRVSPLPYLDLTPLGFAISAVLVTWSIFRQRLLDIVPAARGTVLDNIAEAVLVFDEDERLLDLNRAAEQFLGQRAGEVLGRPFHEFCARPALMAFYQSGDAGSQEVSVQHHDGARWLDVRVAPWHDPKQGRRGRIVTLHDITARKRAEIALRDSEMRYRTLLEATFEGIVVTEAGIIVDVNKTLETMLGIRREALLGRPAVEMAVERFRDEITEHMAHALTDPYEVELIHADGHSFPVEVRGKSIRYEGRPARVAAIRDLTDFKAAQAAEHRQRDLAEALRDVASALNSTLDTETLLDRILDNVHRVMPHTAANVMLIEGDVTRIARTRGYERWTEARGLAGMCLETEAVPNLREMMLTREPLVIPDVTAYPDWQEWPLTRWLRSYAAVPMLVDDEVVGFLNLDSEQPGFFQPDDVPRLQAFADQVATAIRNTRLYSESQRQNRQLELLNEITRAGISALDVNALLNTLARTATLLIDASHSAILLADPSGTIAPAASSGPAALLSEDLGRRLAGEAVEAGKPVPLDDLPADAGLASMLALPLLVGERRLGALVLGFGEPRAFRDADLVWAQQATGLMALALDRAHTLTELRARNEELDAFNYTVAHDLKSPLHGIMVALELLEQFDGEDISAEGSKSLSLARQSAEKLNQLIEGLLTLSRMRADEVPRHLVDMRSVVYSALGRMDTLIQTRNVRVRVHPDLPPALGQETWLEEVFANLISNSIKYAGDDNPSPFITIFAEQNGDHICYAVRDNGMGIDPAHQQHLFDMFSRFHPRAADGVGLGLSIVKRIVTHLDGTITVESEPGKGTTFYISLPAAELEPA